MYRICQSHTTPAHYKAQWKECGDVIMYRAGLLFVRHTQSRAKAGQCMLLSLFRKPTTIEIVTLEALYKHNVTLKQAG